MKKSIIGVASEHQVLGQFLWRSWIAALAYRLFDGFDGKSWAKGAMICNVPVPGWGGCHHLASEIFDSEPEG